MATILNFCRINRKSSTWIKFIVLVAFLIFFLQSFITHSSQRSVPSQESRTSQNNEIITLGSSTSKNYQRTVQPHFPRNISKAMKYSMPLFKEFLNSGYQSPIDHHQISFLTSPKVICNQKLDFLIIIHSSLQNKIRRDTIRTTISQYSTKARLSYKVIFIVGSTKGKKAMKPFFSENIKFQDMLIIDSIDSYKHMLFKAVGWMKWVEEKCSHIPDFIIKMDDDILLKIPQVVDMLKPCLNNSKNPLCKQMSCLFKPDEPALRTGKNKVTLEEYPLTGYPLFCPGLLYMFPTTMLPKMLRATEHIPFIWLDDVYVTAFMMVYLNEPLHSLDDYIVHPKETSLAPLLKNKMAGHFHSKNFRSDYISMWNKMMKSYNETKLKVIHNEKKRKQ